MDVTIVAVVIGGTTFLVVTTLVLVFDRISSHGVQMERAWDDYHAQALKLEATATKSS